MCHNTETMDYKRCLKFDLQEEKTLEKVYMLKCSNKDNSKDLHDKYKIYRNNLFTLMKQKEEGHRSSYFKSNMSNTKNT